MRRREPSVSFSLASEAGATGRDDLSVLQIAAEEGRLLVSHDIRTMPQHFQQFVARQSNPGLLLIPQQLPLSIAIEQLVLIWTASEAEEWKDRMQYLPL